MAILIDRTGEVHGYLVVVARADRNPYGQVMWWCRCKCGKYALVREGYLKNGITKSCGCYQKERTREVNTTHGMFNTRLYGIWEGILQRCENKNNPAYAYYGERGIKVCECWHKFEAFHDWALANGYADDLTIERINSKGDYCPENCCWVDMKAQANNKGSNVFYTINGKTQTLTQHVEDPEINTCKLEYETVRQRIRYRGWTPEEAFSVPLGGKRKY